MTLYLLKKEMVSFEFCIIFNPLNLHAVPKPNEELNHLEPCNRMQFCRHSCMQRDVYKLVYIYFKRFILQGDRLTFAFRRKSNVVVVVGYPLFLQPAPLSDRLCRWARYRFRFLCQSMSKK